MIWQILFGLFCLARAEPAGNTSLHMQITSVSQQHGPFNSPYSGQNSLNPGFESQSSLTWTIFAGAKLWRGGEFYLNPEMAGGSGFSRSTGIAGFPNGEIYRVDDPGPKWNLARMYFRQVIGMGDETIEIKDGKNQLAGTQAVRNVTVVLGKFALNDFFDNNSLSHDPRTQFLNWALMDNAAWDYAADTRGYSWGFMLELNQPDWSLRWATVQVPVRANQLEMDKNFPARRGDNLEFEYRYKVDGRPGTTRALAFANNANMGSYRRAITAKTLDVTQTRSPRTKYGFGLNAEQMLTEALGVFARAGWDDGHSETWNFTEVDRSFSLGLSYAGARWSRPEDRLGLAYMIDGLASDHRDYLAEGGYGFMIGDGKLHYAPEQIAEVYYLVKIIPALELTGDVQYIQNPAYNSDRGPVTVASVRLHSEF